MDDGNLSNPAGGWREKGGGGFWGWNEGVGCVGVAESQPVPAGLRRGGEGIWGGGTRPGVVDSTRQVYVSCRQCTLQHCASSRVPPQSWLYPSLAQPCRKPCWALRFAVELTVPDRYPREPSFPRCNPCYRRLLDEWLASEALVGQAPEGSNDCHPDSSMDSAGYPSSGIALLSALPSPGPCRSDLPKLVKPRHAGRRLVASPDLLGWGRVVAYINTPGQGEDLCRLA